MTAKRPYRIGIWCAVSSQPQAEKVSLSDQEQAGRKFADERGGEVVAIYRTAHTRDVTFYEEAAQEMDSYRQLREDISQERLDILWAFDEDRLGRDPGLAQTLISMVEKRGNAELYIATSPHVIGQKGAGHRYLHSIKLTRASEDQELRRIRHRSGMRGRIKRGLPPGRWPQGYEAIRDETGQTTGGKYNRDIGAIDLMTSLFLAGHSYPAIMRALNDSEYRPPKAPQWNYHTVYHTLNSDFYAGYPTWGNTRPDEPSELYPARWDPDTHAAIIRERRRRSRMYNRSGSGPLRGVAFCARCGGPMSRDKSQATGTRFLRCSRHANRWTGYGRYDCHSNRIPEQLAVQAVADFLETLATPGAIESAIQTDSSQGTDLQADLDIKIKELAAIEQQRDRAFQLVSEGTMTPDVYRRNDDKLLQQREATQRRIQELQQQLEALPDLDAQRADLEQLISSFPKIISEEEPAVIATALQNVGIQVLIDNGQILTVVIRP